MAMLDTLSVYIQVVVTGKGYEKRYTLSPSKPRELGKSLEWAQILEGICRICI